MEACAAAVAVAQAAFCYDKPFDYRIPPALAGKVSPGCRVTVPFGRSNASRIGLVLELLPNPPPDPRRKAILTLLDPEPVLSPELTALVPWLKEHTFCTLYEAMRAMLPAGIQRRMQITYSALPPEQCPPEALLDETEAAMLDYLRGIRGKSCFVKRTALLQKFRLPPDSDLPEHLAAQGFLLRGTDALAGAAESVERMVRLTQADGEPANLTPKQAEVCAFLREAGAASVKEICYFTGFSPNLIATLVRKGIAAYFERPVFRIPFEAEDTPQPEDVLLTPEQSGVYERLRELQAKNEGACALLFGVTGSGKTQVYLKLIDDALAQGKSAIVMVPEIALTPQMLQLFARRYGRQVAVFHSALSVGERMDEWRRVKEGKASLVLGTRSAIFAPVQRLGLVVMDEEHEHTYLSEQSPRYHARDVAKFRCAYHRALLLLASATPSVESYAAALRGSYQLEVLEHRYGSALLPEVRTVDLLAEQRRQRGTGAAGTGPQLSEELRRALLETIARGHQAILLINRRGYHTFLACAACGHVIRCPQCAISLTYHQANQRLMCHYCGHSAPAPEACPLCGKPAIRFGGAGTQKIEEELARLPDCRAVRMDADAAGSRTAREDILDRFAKGEYNVLVGTQMVAKGLDFENVTLVGVVSIDQQLYHDDYRSLERCFDLLTQVVGRAGRGRYRGVALVQSTTPENEIIRLAAQQDYRSFFAMEIKLRRLLVYPPYCTLCLLGALSEDESLARAAAKFLLERLRQRSAEETYRDEKLIVLGPMPARISKLANKFRWRLLIKCHDNARLRALIAQLLIDVGKESRFQQVTAYADLHPETIF
ncbi:MAG: primosomal protein N' [Oscillospiraceae bacterium]|jgi:primosomal protein N' (replication factor Y)|nr:primosomal protein N' [Oscillospiraceae bacterium]